MLSFDPTLLIVSMIPSSVGFVLFVYGKKLARFPQLFAGLALMVYPYFTDTLRSMAAIGILIIALLWVAVEMGY